MAAGSSKDSTVPWQLLPSVAYFQLCSDFPLLGPKAGIVLIWKECNIMLVAMSAASAHFLNGLERSYRELLENLLSLEMRELCRLSSLLLMWLRSPLAPRDPFSLHGSYSCVDCFLLADSRLRNRTGVGETI